METGQAYAYTGDDPVNGVDPLGLCATNGIYLVPGACHFTSRTWVAQVEGGFQLQKTQAMESGLAKFWGGIEDFADTLTGNPLAYCGPGSGEEAGLANVLDLGAALGNGNPELDAEDEDAAATSVGSSTGVEPYYPPNDGFFGDPVDESIQPGTVVDRYGTESGRFVSPEGTPIYQRSLPPDVNTAQQFSFEVIRPLPVQAGTVAPAFGEAGGGTQYLLQFSTGELVRAGYLKPIG